jgi:hypothetical protein
MYSVLWLPVRGSQAEVHHDCHSSSSLKAPLGPGIRGICTSADATESNNENAHAYSTTCNFKLMEP